MKSKSLLLTIAALLGLRINTTAQTPPAYVPTDGLAAWWPFNGNANDESGNENHGNVYGATTTSDRFGFANSAMSFNGSSNYISVPYSNTIGVQQEITVSFWVYFDGGSCGPRIMQSMPWGQCGGYTIATNTSDNSSRYFYTNFDNCVVGVLSSSSPNLSCLSWKHVVWSASGLTGISTMYFDGVLVDTDVTNVFFSSVNYFNRPLTIGNIDPNSCDWFGGFLDDIGIWNRALNQEEITNLFNASVPSSISSNYPKSNLTIYPNPTEDRLTLEFGKGASLNGYALVIENSLGQQVYEAVITQQTSTISMGSLAGKGLYFLRIFDTQGNAVDVRKVVVE